MIVDEPCCVCGLDADTGMVITDTSGGSFGAVCDGCIALLDTSRCVLCGDPRPTWGRGRRGTVHVDGREDIVGDVCPSCRTLMINGSHGGVPAVTNSARVCKVLANVE